MKTERLRGDRRDATSLLLLFTALAPIMAGCAARTAAPHVGRLAIRGQRAVVRVEGRGTVISADAIACGAHGSRCEAEWNDIATPSLFAVPERGWTFARWEWTPIGPAAPPTLAPDASAHLYTAIFAPARAAGETAGPPR